MHDLTDVEGVVSAVVDLAADHHLNSWLGKARHARRTRPCARVEAVLEAFPPWDTSREKIAEHHPRCCGARRWKPETPCELMTLSLVFVALLLLR